MYRIFHEYKEVVAWITASGPTITTLQVRSLVSTIQIIIFNNTVQYNETTTMDIGDTSDLTWSVVIVGSDAVIQATTSLYSWNIRYILRSV